MLRGKKGPSSSSGTNEEIEIGSWTLIVCICRDCTE